ncbi:hypothetical protein FVEG_15539 [Fusarium verticillioides 7600]|uniref:Uncharacterized protein n=1 Tax=Gibberella moniliformis (strain M3125 / FGSC 7600) TaxID=334819 RepID=W7M6K2_GIBM7|nr:hypothetical protein FVEG_15539 [Fusarium verticillioides 7600]EWG43195.1 hypothetical protein FVEG_15539 [Fusarium verticillioides 7600]
MPSSRIPTPNRPTYDKPFHDMVASSTGQAVSDASVSCLPTGITALNLGQHRVEINPCRDSVARYGQSTSYNPVIAIFDDSLTSSVNYGLDIVLISPGNLDLVVLFDTLHRPHIGM